MKHISSFLLVLMLVAFGSINTFAEVSELYEVEINERGLYYSRSIFSVLTLYDECCDFTTMYDYACNNGGVIFSFYGEQEWIIQMCKRIVEGNGILKGVSISMTLSNGSIISTNKGDAMMTDYAMSEFSVDHGNYFSLAYDPWYCSIDGVTHYNPTYNYFTRLRTYDIISLAIEGNIINFSKRRTAFHIDNMMNEIAKKGGYQKNMGKRMQLNDVASIQINGNTFTINGATFEMVLVEGGTFSMGSSDKDPWANEIPSHNVTLSNYYIGQTEVTQGLWKAVMGNNPSEYQGDDFPVNCVSWNDCQLFISKLNNMTGKHFRLPTEAEWEFAAKGGNNSHGYKYSGSNNVDEVAWVKENSDKKPHPVGTKSANELGVYDMSGSVNEWCNDWFDYYTDEAQINPLGPSKGYERVVRGGSWIGWENESLISRRYKICEQFGRFTTGFRLVLAP